MAHPRKASMRYQWRHSRSEQLTSTQLPRASSMPSVTSCGGAIAPGFDSATAMNRAPPSTATAPQATPGLEACSGSKAEAAPKVIVPSPAVHATSRNPRVRSAARRAMSGRVSAALAIRRRWHRKLLHAAAARCLRRVCAAGVHRGPCRPRTRRTAHRTGGRDPASHCDRHAEPGDRRPPVHQPVHRCLVPSSGLAPVRCPDEPTMGPTSHPAAAKRPAHGAASGHPTDRPRTPVATDGTLLRSHHDRRRRGATRPATPAIPWRSRCDTRCNANGLGIRPGLECDRERSRWRGSVAYLLLGATILIGAPALAGTTWATARLFYPDAAWGLFAFGVVAVASGVTRLAVSLADVRAMRAIDGTRA